MNAIWRVAKYGFQYPWLFGGAYAMNVASTLSALAVPPLIGNAIDRALGSGSHMEVLLAGLAMSAACSPSRAAIQTDRNQRSTIRGNGLWSITASELRWQ